MIYSMDVKMNNGTEFSFEGDLVKDYKTQLDKRMVNFKGYIILNDTVLNLNHVSSIVFSEKRGK